MVIGIKPGDHTAENVIFFLQRSINDYEFYR